MTLRLAELCAGYGGLGLGLELAGIDHHLVWYAETDRHASSVMAAHSDAPNLGDVVSLTDPPPADIVTAGFPCQPVSVAGDREGVDDERWLIHDVVSVWRRSHAPWLILENVSGLFSANSGQAFAEVLDALSQVGATAQWAHLRAADVGAPHGRERWFCLAHADSTGPEGTRHGGSRQSALCGTAFPDTNGNEPERRRGPDPVAGPPRSPRDPDRPGTDPNRDAVDDCGAVTPDTDSDGFRELGLDGLEREPRRDPDRCNSERFGGYAAAVQRWEDILGRPAPDPTVEGRLNAQFAEWMMGLPDGWVTDHLSRRQSLRVLGNGVVPQQAAFAIHSLAKDFK